MILVHISGQQRWQSKANRGHGYDITKSIRKGDGQVPHLEKSKYFTKCLT